MPVRSRFPAPKSNDGANGNFPAAAGRQNAIRAPQPVGANVPMAPGMGVLGGNVGCAPPAVLVSSGVLAPQDPNNWRQAGEEMRRLRTRHVVLIERMLRNHQPHDVLTQVPENVDWHSKTFTLAIKIERLMFAAATSRENYLNEATLRQRVQLLSRHLVRIRKRKNAVAASYETRV